MRMTALVENKALPGLCCEHGLAVHIVYKGKQYLLDTGSSDLFLENAKRLGIHLDEVNAAALSHGHYDHSGGYEGFFAVNEKAKVYVRAEAKGECLKITEEEKYIGVPKGLFEKYPDRFQFIDEDIQMDEGVWLIGHHTKGLEEKGRKSRMYYRVQGIQKPDDFSHEQSLVFEVQDGLVILNSCSHGGIDTIVEEVQKVFPGKAIKAVVGGFHLMGVDGVTSMRGTREEVDALGERVRNLGVEHIYTGHCTGEPAYALLEELLGEQISYFRTGVTIDIEE